MVTQEQIKEVLHYDPLTGEFTWLKSLRVGSIGKLAGTITQDSRVHIAVFGRVYKAHRLAWLYMVGEWPLGEVDHINGIPNDNRWNNLRGATRSQNSQNKRRPKNNTSGVKNVFPYRGKYMVQITSERGRYCDSFPTLEQATDMANRMRTILHGEFASE